jgi:serine/threonine protein kinase
MDRRERLEELLAEAQERQTSDPGFDADSWARQHPEFESEIRAHLRVLPMADRAMEGPVSSAERDRVRAAVRRLLAADRNRGGIAEIGHYKNLFPGFWDVVAEEYRAGLAQGPEQGTTRREPGAGGAAAPRARTTPADADSIGHYRLQRELGRGGMGVVYLSEDTRLRRRVALKVLSPVFASSRDLQARFQREAAIASRLDHPGICTIYEAGEADGVPFIAMRYVQGETLEHWINAARVASGLGEKRGPGTTNLPRRPGEPERPDPAPAPGAERRPTSGAETREEIVRIVHLLEKAARAVHAAHEAGLIHRDIKPGNIMVTLEGEPVLLDFGLARDEEGTGASITQTGALMGTPAYMSPEQIAAQRIRLDRRTDVYSLGVTLYETLTLRLPFAASSRDSLYQKILVSEPENVRKLNPAVPADLKVVIDKSLEKDRERRYPTALEFGEDLRRVREGEPVAARPIGTVTRLQRWMRRNPGVAVPTLGFVGLLITLPPAALYLFEKGKQSVSIEGQDDWDAVRTRMKQKYETAGNPTLQRCFDLFDSAVRARKRTNYKDALIDARQIPPLLVDFPEAADLKAAAQELINEIDSAQQGR